MSGWISSRSSKMIWTVGIYNGLKKIDNQIAREKAMKRSNWWESSSSSKTSSSSSKKEPYKSPSQRREEEMKELKEQILDFLMANEGISYLASEIAMYVESTTQKIMICCVKLEKEGKITRIAQEKGASRYMHDWNCC